jgi:sugar lactone lactonase YvrE
MRLSSCLLLLVLATSTGAMAGGASSQPVRAPVIAPAPEAPPPPPAPKVGSKLWSLEGMQTPESVLWDGARNRYLVSNINGKPTDSDNNGYIAAVGVDGKLIAEKLIAGGVNGVKLHAPKGMALVGDTLYVADITVVRLFDLVTGKSNGTVKLPGATFVNDLVAAADGKVYATDSGLKPDFSRSNTDAIWVIERTKAKKLLATPELNQPNGIMVNEASQELLLVSFGGAELRRINLVTKAAKAVTAVQALPGGGGDGLCMIGDKLVFSSWEKKAIFLGNSDGTSWISIADMESPADFACANGQIVVPRFQGNGIDALLAP